MLSMLHNKQTQARDREKAAIAAKRNSMPGTTGVQGRKESICETSARKDSLPVGQDPKRRLSNVETTNGSHVNSGHGHPGHMNGGHANGGHGSGGQRSGGHLNGAQGNNKAHSSQSIMVSPTAPNNSASSNQRHK